MSPAKSHRERIAEEIRRRITSGEWEPGRKLPTTRDLAVEFRCAGGTVEWALDRLMAEGWIRGHQGLGRYVADTPPAG